MPRIRYIVLTCDKYADRQQALLKTWGRKQHIVFLEDGPPHRNGRGHAQLEGETFQQADYVERVGYDTPPGYDNVAHKFIAFLRDPENRRRDEDWFFFCDDDAYVFVRRLEEFLAGRSPGHPQAIGGHYCFAPAKDYQPLRGRGCEVPVHYCGGGAGFALSAVAVDKLFDYMGGHDDPPWAGFSDVSFGFWFRACGIQVVPEPRFNAMNPDQLKHGPEIQRQQLSYHWLAPATFEVLEQYA